MVTIRLARHGGKKQPFYHLTVAEKSAKRDGRFIERLGFYNPVARGGEQELRIDLNRADYWLSVGAQPTERALQLITRYRKSLAEESEVGEVGEAAETSPGCGRVGFKAWCSSVDPVVIGAVGAPFGVHGWVHVKSFTAPPGNLLDYRPWQLRRNSAWRGIDAEARPHRQGFVACIDGCSDRG